MHLRQRISCNATRARARSSPSTHRSMRCSVSSDWRGRYRRRTGYTREHAGTHVNGALRRPPNGQLHLPEGPQRSSRSSVYELSTGDAGGQRENHRSTEPVSGARSPGGAAQHALLALSECLRHQYRCWRKRSLRAISATRGDEKELGVSPGIAIAAHRSRSDGNRRTAGGVAHQSLRYPQHCLRHRPELNPVAR